MANVNYSIQEMAHLALGIIFIISVVAANCLLVISLLRQHRTVYAVRTAVLLSLVVGDIMLALFSLLVDLLGEDALRCNSTFFSRVYRNYMLQFVYSIGLLMLALCLMIAYKKFEQQQPQYQQQQAHAFNGAENPGQSMGYRSGRSRVDEGERKTLTLGLALICSGVPWLVALIVIIPLTAPRLTICNAHSEVSRERIYLWACVILPASLAVFVSSGVAVALKPKQELYTMVDTGDTGEALPLQSSPAVPDRFHDNATAVTAFDDVTSRCADGHAQTAESTSASPLYPDPSFDQQQTLEPMAGYDNALATSVSHQEPSPRDQRMTLNFSREKTGLLVVAIVHFVCVIPNAAFALTFANNPQLHNEIDNVMFAVLSDLCKWLAVLRSVLAPLCWIAFLRN